MSGLTLAAVGDISFARKTEAAIKNHGLAYPFAEIMDELRAGDIRFGNLESVLIPEDFPLERASGRPLQSRDVVADALRLLEFDILHMASHHVLDCGWRGLMHTYGCSRTLGVQPLGAGPNQHEARKLRTIEKKGTTVGFLGYLQAGDWTLEGGGGRIAYLKAQDVISDIQRYRGQVDVLVISIHGDIEFQPAPSMPRMTLCRQIAQAGADLILCHHPHVPQGVEKWGDCLINYSLGNFLFDTDGYQIGRNSNVNRSHVFLVTIENGKIAHWRRRYLRLHPDEGGRPKPIPEKEYANEDAYYRSLDAMLADPDALRKSWRENCLRRLSAIMRKFAADAEADPKQFLRKYGKVLFSDMAQEYMQGLYEMAREEYEKQAYGDFEYARPFAPYEQ